MRLDPDASGLRAALDDGPAAATILQRILDHLPILAAALPAADVELGRVDILTPTHRVLNGGTPSRLPDYPGVTLHELFRLQAWRTPDAPALVSDAVTVTYRELDHASSVLSRRLTNEVSPGDVVGVCSERSVELFVAIIAILKAGAAFVFLDPDVPAARLSQFVEVSRPRLVLVGPGSSGIPTTAPTTSLPSISGLLTAEPVAAPDVLVGPHSPAYVLFTSGSTGVPKAVLRSHRLHTSRVFLEQSIYGLGSEDRHLLKLPLSSRELFWPLATGGACVLVPPGAERDDQELLRIMRVHRVSVLSIVPSMLRVLAASTAFATLPALRHVFVGGETLHSDLESRVRSFGYEVHTTFTLTEADYVTHRSGPAPSSDGEVSNIGRPLDMRVYVCDDHGRRVPPGVTGEVWTGGPGLAEGYLHEPARTAERFVPNPFDDPQVPVLFRSGDLAQIRADGSFDYLGRRDLQVKIRGQRVEPTEVEHWIRSHPGVDNAAVVGYADLEQGAVLVAFVARTDDTTTERELREHLAEQVPGWMIPRHFTFVPRLPQMPNGKVDRVALRLPERERPGDLPPPTRPDDPRQTTLVGLWRRVLQLEQIGVDDDFFELGGDSLRLLLLRAAIQDELGVTIDAVHLLAATTVRAQAGLWGAAPAGSTHGVERARPSREDAARERDRRAALRRAHLDNDDERSLR
ncbi:non-ribosomal peptide synthetase [Oerskovia sp. NPDC060338]|uniref:non-ribosomal peptide synthetase n=1 Tax=Oerskovia sp. NPDC060338 TaxID=3347100 RepID=UPI003664684F